MVVMVLVIVPIPPFPTKGQPGLFDTMFASALVFLNLGMQSAFSIILLTPAFMGEEFESKIQSAQAWRTSVAHDERWAVAK